MGRSVAGATAAAAGEAPACWAVPGWAGPGWAGPGWAAGAALGGMTAPVTALPAAVRVRRNFGCVRREVLIRDNGNLRSARHGALGCHPGTCQLPAESAGRAAAYGRDAGAGRRAAQRRPFAR